MWLDLVVDALFPARCAGCGTSGSVVCDACAAGMHRAPAVPDPPWLDAFAAPFAYEGVARELVARVKYRNERAAVPWLATRMAALAPSDAAGLVVTWVPTTATRRSARGFDHGERLACRVARELAVPCRPLLRRLDDTAQTGRTRAERMRSGPRFAARPGAGGAVLLVDDVVTTGATLASAARALRSRGTTHVSGVAAARRP